MRQGDRVPCRESAYSPAGHAEVPLMEGAMSRRARERIAARAGRRRAHIGAIVIDWKYDAVRPEVVHDLEG